MLIPGNWLENLLARIGLDDRHIYHIIFCMFISLIVLLRLRALHFYLDRRSIIFFATIERRNKREQK
jgi:hypothetical protein